MRMRKPDLSSENNTLTREARGYLRNQLFEVSTASGSERGSIIGATLATARGTDLELTWLPVRMPMRIKLYQ